MRKSIQTRRQYKIVGGDFSAQEPRLTTFMSQDENMLKAYQEGKDLYAVIASMSFNKPYNDCLEFNPETGAKQVDGKERRSQAKSVLLGLEYGRGSASIGEQIGKSRADAQEIINKFFTSFPKVKNWIDEVHSKVKELGYVEDWYGRRRHLPDIKLKPYTAELINNDNNIIFNPFLNCNNRVKSNSVIDKYLKECESIRYNKEFEELKAKALKEGVILTANTNKIAQAERQSVNSIIQGGAATLTKLAMINIDNDKILNDLGFRLLVTIHDEVLGECPEQNSEKVAKRLCEVMIDTAKPYMNVPQSVDAYQVYNWYFDENAAEIQKEYEDLLKNNMSSEEAKNKLILEHSEFLVSDIDKMLSNKI